MAQYERQSAWPVVLIAGMAGAGLGLLLAPRSGKESRHRLREAAADAKQSTIEGIDNAREQIDDKLDKVRDVKSRWASNIKKKVNREDSPEVDAMDSPILRAWDEGEV